MNIVIEASSRGWSNLLHQVTCFFLILTPMPKYRDKNPHNTTILGGGMKNIRQ